MAELSDMGFEIPSKTFIIGEYLAMNGTASMVLASEPSFYFKVIEDERYGFHPDSPAGRLRAHLKSSDSKFDSRGGYSVFDPHDGRGGFGRSTAEYLAVYLHDQALRLDDSNPNEKILSELEEFVHQYQAMSGSEYKPSGADLVAQVCGGLCWYDGMNFKAEKLSWPFPGYDIYIFHTGKKLNTHEHLKDLKKLDLRSLIPILIASRTAMSQENLKVFCESLNYYYDRLNELGLSDPGVYKSVLNLRESEIVLAAKGCGAMGVDTVLVVGQSSEQQGIKELCLAEDFQYIGSLSEAHQGACLRRPI